MWHKWKKNEIILNKKNDYENKNDDFDNQDFDNQLIEKMEKLENKPSSVVDIDDYDDYDIDDNDDSYDIDVMSWSYQDYDDGRDVGE